MRRLVLLRHGKSDWEADAPTDHARPLAARGVRAAQTMGRLLTSIGQAPDLVVSSSAERALATARLAAEAGGWTCPIESSDDLYLTFPQSVLNNVKATPPDVGSLMLVGHEPTWSTVAELLTGGDVRVPTGTAVGIDIEARSWLEVAPGRGTITWVLPPRLFTDNGLDI